VTRPTCIGVSASRDAGTSSRGHERFQAGFLPGRSFEGRVITLQCYPRRRCRRDARRRLRSSAASAGASLAAFVCVATAEGLRGIGASDELWPARLSLESADQRQHEGRSPCRSLLPRWTEKTEGVIAPRSGSLVQTFALASSMSWRCSRHGARAAHHGFNPNVASDERHRHAALFVWWRRVQLPRLELRLIGVVIAASGYAGSGRMRTSASRSRHHRVRRAVRSDRHRGHGCRHRWIEASCNPW